MKNIMDRLMKIKTVYIVLFLLGSLVFAIHPFVFGDSRLVIFTDANDVKPIYSRVDSAVRLFLPSSPVLVSAEDTDDVRMRVLSQNNEVEIVSIRQSSLKDTGSKITVCIGEEKNDTFHFTVMTRRAFWIPPDRNITVRRSAERK